MVINKCDIGLNVLDSKFSNAACLTFVLKTFLCTRLVTSTRTIMYVVKSSLILLFSGSHQFDPFIFCLLEI